MEPDQLMSSEGETPSETFPGMEEDEEEIPVTFEEEELALPSPLEILEVCPDQFGVEVLDQLKEQLGRWLRQEGEADLASSWVELDHEVGQRYHYFSEGLRFQEWDDATVEAGREIFEQFDWLQQQLVRFDQARSLDDALEMAFSLQQMAVTLQAQQRAFERLRQGQPQPGPFPLLEELNRVGQLVVAEKLPMEMFEERLMTFCELQERFQQGLQAGSGTPREREILDQERESLEKALAVQSAGLDELHQFRQSGDQGLLEAGMEALEEAAHLMARVGERLAGVDTAQDGRACPFCSQVNSRASRFCSGCQARLPESVQDASAGALDSESREDGNLGRLAAAVRNAHQHPLEFQQTLAWYREIHGRACQQLNGLKPCPAEAPADQRELLERTQRVAQEALDEIGAGLESMAAGDDLDLALQRVIAGEERLLEVERLYQERESLASLGPRSSELQ